MIRLEGLSRRWPGFAIRDISLTVEKGEFLVVMGPTGAGKTLLLELLLGIHQPDSGHVWLDGRVVTTEAPERRGIGMVYQDYLLFPHLTVAENLAFGLRYRKLKKQERACRVEEAASMLGIVHLLDRYENTLSGGERQRVALGRALVTRPRVLLMDEPLSALDRGTARRLRADLKALHQANGLTTIHVTHDLSEARFLGDRVALIHEGSLETLATPEELLRRPPTLFAANFVGAVNVLPATVLGKDQSSPAESIVVRPDDIVLRAGEPAGPNLVCGEIIALEDEGSVVEVRIRVPGWPAPLVAHTARQTLRAQGLGIGSVVTADLSSAVHEIRSE